MSITAQLADGTRLEFPDGTDPAVIQRTVKNLMAQRAPGGQRPAEPAPNGLGTDGQNFAAGIGQGVMSLARGAGQLVRKLSPIYAYSADRLGLPGDQATIDEARRLDAPLLNTKAGLAGSVVGQVVPAVLAAPVMGSGVVAGGVSGGALGAAQPVATGESRAQNITIGTAAGAAAPIIARGLSAGLGAVRGVMEPFTEGGRQAIAGRTLQRFGVAADDLRGLTSTPTVTGARTTLAEQITRPEGAAAAARLQDAVRTLDPEIAARMTAREVENNAARVNALRALAGVDGGREFAVANRAGTAGPMYQEAFNVAADARPLTAEQTRAMRQLMRAPAIKEAAAAARANAANAGGNVGASNASGSVAGLHQMKLALDDMIAKAENKTTGAAANTAAGLRDAQRRLVGFIESISPEYANARGVYAQMSRPVNQMDVAGEVLRRGTSSTSDLAGYPRLMPNALTGALRDEGALMQRATGRRVGNALSDLLDPPQEAMLRAVAGEVDRGAAVARAANGPGSATAQRLASNNLLQQIGLPENMTDNAFVQTLMRPVQFGAQMAEPRIQQLLLEVIQNPGQAAAVMARATPAQRIALDRIISNPQLLQAARQSIPAASLGASNGSQ
jgi:hypothetical protein